MRGISATSGMQFMPDGLTDLPKIVNVDVPDSASPGQTLRQMINTVAPALIPSVEAQNGLLATFRISYENSTDTLLVGTELGNEVRKIYEKDPFAPPSALCLDQFYFKSDGAAIQAAVELYFIKVK